MAKTNVEKFGAVLERMERTYIAKNHDYGDAFHQSYEEFGLVSPVIRLTDKLNRLKSLCHNAEKGAMVKDESIQDTLLDLANYAVMTLAEMEKEEELTPEEEMERRWS